MTIKDAKEKWCPMVQIAIGPMGDIITNRLDQFNNIDCKADECACWKWDRETGETTMANIAPDEWQGHCGLAR